MPFPGMPGVPYFDGTNITDFLTLFEVLFSDHGLTEEEGLRRLPSYCKFLTGGYIRTTEEWISSNWGALKEALLDEYRYEDDYQQKTSLRYLEALKDRGCTTTDSVQLYHRQYYAISTCLAEKGMLDGYTRAVWFLQGLPVDIRARIIHKHSVSLERPSTL